MSKTSRRPRPIDRSIPNEGKETHLVVIATEGELTEKQYFEPFGFQDSRVQIMALPSHDGESSPRHVLARLRKYRQRYEIDQRDHFWLAVDYDRWGDRMLAEIATGARQIDCNLAVSRQCFEIWLYLHHADLPPGIEGMSSRQVKDALRRLLGGYDEAELVWARFAPGVDDAIRRARVLDVSPDERWPNQVGTRAYRVIEAIRALAPLQI